MLLLKINLVQALGAKSITENLPVVNYADIVFVSVKPGVVPTVLHDVKKISSGKLFISVAMGVTINEMEKVTNAIKKLITFYCFN